MKKKVKILVPVVAVVLIVAISLGLVFFRSNIIKKDATAEFYYENDYEGIYISTALTEEETQIIREMIVHAKVRHNKELTDSFNESIYLAFNSGNKVKRYYIACDASPYLQYNLGGTFLELEDWEIDKLHSILGRYGAYFPYE